MTVGIINGKVTVDEATETRVWELKFTLLDIAKRMQKERERAQFRREIDETMKFGLMIRFYRDLMRCI